MTYEEMLRANGASDEDIKVLSNSAARKVFDTTQAQIAEATAARDASIKAKSDYEAQTKKWYDEQIVPEYQRMQSETVVSKAEAARAKAAIIAARDQGLTDIAKDLGWEVDPVKAAAAAAAAASPQFDASKYVTQDRLAELAENAGAGLAALQDLVMEHAQLFPDKPLKVRELRAEAVAARKSVDQYWLEKYGVPAAREKRDSEAKSAYESRLRKEGEDKVRQEFADRQMPGNGPFMPSTSPLAPRTAALDPERGGKQPWQYGDQANNRVRKATQAVINQQGTGATGVH